MKRNKNKNAKPAPKPATSATPAAKPPAGADRATLLQLRLDEQRGENRPEIIASIDQQLGELHKERPIVIKITRHIAGPPRRSPGQVLTMTDAQIQEQRLTREDYKVINRLPVTDGAMKPKDITTR